MSSRSLYESLLRIRNSPEFSELRAWLDARQEAALKVLTCSQDDRKMYQAQGAYGAVQELKDLIESAPVVLDKQRRG